MDETRKVIFGLPPGVTITVYALDTDTAQEIMKQYPNAKGQFDSIVVISGLSAWDARMYSSEIQSAILAAQKAPLPIPAENPPGGTTL